MSTGQETPVAGANGGLSSVGGWLLSNQKNASTLAAVSRFDQASHYSTLAISIGSIRRCTCCPQAEKDVGHWQAI
jgi:hypothetical protein